MISLLVLIIAGWMGVQAILENWKQQRDNSNRQAVAGDMQSFGAQVLAYLKTPASMGGGSGAIVASDAASIASWMGWSAVTLTNDNAQYTLTTEADKCTITANNKDTFKIEIPVTARRMTDLIINFKFP